MNAERLDVLREREELIAIRHKVKDRKPIPRPPERRDFKAPKVPITGITLTVACPILIAVIPGLFADNTLSWSTRIIIGLFCTCGALFVLFMSTYLENYRTSYTIQLLEYEVEHQYEQLERLGDVADVIDSALESVNRLLDVDEKLVAKAGPEDTEQSTVQ